MTVKTGATLWHLLVEAPDEVAADAAAQALESAAPGAAVSAFETAPGGAWRVEGFAEAAPDAAALRGALMLAGAMAGGGADLAAALTIEPLPPRDWLAENQESFPPLRAGRFFIYGSHVAGRGVPPGLVGLRIDAATAFGTGEHATTRGCLLALDGLAKPGLRPRRILDMGTGTGILALAASRVWRGRPALACDIDAGSVRVARNNVRVNGAAGAVRVRWSDGYADRAVRALRPYDLVFANILARPLARMAPDLRAALAPGGVAILSGLLARQERFVLAAHRAQGLTLRRRYAINGWHTLVVALGAAADATSEPDRR